jgi:glutathione S-transferase
MATTQATPVLWQLRRAIFPEKARWALDFKGVAHERKDLMPGVHPLVLKLRGRGTTVPALDIDGRSVCGSSAIVAALEETHPEPPLYPGDPAERDEALRLEAYFDDLGHDVRRVGLDPLLADPDLLFDALLVGRPRMELAFTRAAYPLVSRGIRRQYRIDDETVRRARERVTAAVDQIESRLGASGYLVGDRFSVADLAGAALLGALLAPPEYPDSQWSTAAMPAGLKAFSNSLAVRPGGRWVLEMYRRHRGEKAEIKVGEEVREKGTPVA